MIRYFRKRCFQYQVWNNVYTILDLWMENFQILKVLKENIGWETLKQI